MWRATLLATLLLLAEKTCCKQNVIFSTDRSRTAIFAIHHFAIQHDPTNIASNTSWWKHRSRDCPNTRCIIHVMGGRDNLNADRPENHVSAKKRNAHAARPKNGNSLGKTRLSNLYLLTSTNVSKNTHTIFSQNPPTSGTRAAFVV